MTKLRNFTAAEDNFFLTTPVDQGLVIIWHFWVETRFKLTQISLYYAEACNEFAWPTSASLCPSNTAPFKETLQQWQAVGNTESDLTAVRFEP